MTTSKTTIPTTSQAMTLTPFADGLWTVSRDLRFFGVETGTRMTVVQLSCGGVLLHSPVAITEELKAAVEAIGPIKAMVAPSLFHHMFIGQWMEAYPEAIACCCPGLERKRKDIAWHSVLDDEPHEIWRDDLAQCHFGARKLENEVVFFHKTSRTLLCSDFIFHLSSHQSWLTRLVAKLLGNGKPGATWMERLMIRDKANAKRQLDTIVSWEPQQIILAHGELIHQDATALIKDAYGWLLG